jgi:hypothetical protein
MSQEKSGETSRMAKRMDRKKGEGPGDEGFERRI